MRYSIQISLALVAVLFAPAAGDNGPRKSVSEGSPAASSSVDSDRDSDSPARDKLNKATPAKATVDKRRGSPGLTSAREAAAMAFVKQHHPELVDLLLYLKQNQPAAYEQAVMDLFRASERLAQQKEVNYDRYEIDLALWKVESRIELLAAKLKMVGRDSPEGESLVPQLKKLLEERHDVRAERLMQERRRITDRVEKIDRQLEAMAANREQAIERELNRFVAPPASARPPQKNKPAR